MSIKLLRHVEHDLKPVNRRSKSRDHDPSLRFREDLFKRIIREIKRSLPGMMRADNTTVSPSSIISPL